MTTKEQAPSQEPCEVLFDCNDKLQLIQQLIADGNFDRWNHHVESGLYLILEEVSQAIVKTANVFQATNR